MLHIFLEPFTTDFVLRALAGGALVALVCGVVGTWVVIRGMAFLGEALGHGMLPGVAVATVVGLPTTLGAAASAVAMSALIGWLQRRGRLSYDTSIGLLFVAMLSLGVIIVSHSRSFATDATAILFGDILAVTTVDVWLLAGAALLTIAVALTCHRRFVAAAFDPRISATLGLRPQLAQVALVGLVTLAVVSSYQAVGSLLVVGLLIAPAVAAAPWTRSVPARMALASACGGLSVFVGLLASWHAGTAAGASIAASAIVIAAGSGAVRRLSRRAGGSRAGGHAGDHARGGRRRTARTARIARVSGISGVAAVSLLLASCSASGTPDLPTADAEHGKVSGAAEVSEPPLHLVSIDAGGSASLLNLLDGTETRLDDVRAPRAVTSDGRYAFVADDAGVDIIDSGAWTWDHVDHFHYYQAAPGAPGTVSGDGVATVATGMLATAGGTGVFFPESGEAVLLDNAALSQGEIKETLRIDVVPHDGLIAPLGDGALVSEAQAGGVVERLRAIDDTGTEVDSIACAEASGTITTRLALVVGCADGAVLATAAAGEVSLTLVPYPAGAAPAATEFSARKGRPTVAGLGEGSGVWLLDTRARSWSWITTAEHPLAASAVDDETQHVVTLSPDGSVRVLNADGAELGTTESLVTVPHGAEPHGTDPAVVSLTVDAQRAYVNNPGTGTVYEIDYADTARVARTIETGVPSDFLVETGR